MFFHTMVLNGTKVLISLLRKRALPALKRNALHPVIIDRDKARSATSD
jgi:hypothetical protein